MSFLFSSAQLDNTIAELRERNDALEARVAKLEAQLPKAALLDGAPERYGWLWAPATTAEVEVQRVKDALTPRFTAGETYRYNSASIRVRIIDNAFAALNQEERLDYVDTYLDKLPPEIQQQIVMLQLFTEEEARISPPAWPE